MVKLPLPTAMHLALRRSMIDEAYGADIARARREHGFHEIEKLESARHFELTLLQEEEDAHLTRQLLSKARGLRVPVPRLYKEDGVESEHWYRGDQTGGWYLTDLGIAALREEIRRELKARHDARAQLVVWLSALTGVTGALTGLLAVLASQ